MSTVTNEVVNMESSETNGKNANMEETDLGSAASSNNTSGDEEGEEDEDEDPEIQFKQRRTTRSATQKNKRIKTKTNQNNTNKANGRIRRGSPLNKRNPPRNGSNSNASNKKSSISTCQLCDEALSSEELGRHLSLTHFKSKLAKLLPSEKPYKCPKCSSIEENHDNLIGNLEFQYDDTFLLVNKSNL